MSEAQTTQDHDTIRKWAEARGGRPATVRGTGGKDDSGILRLDFQEPDEGLDALSWDEFFEKFDEANLSFLYQDKTGDGAKSRFHKFVHGGKH